MPLISVTYATHRETPSLKAVIAAAITELTAEILHKDPKVTAVIVKAVDPAGWFAGGKSLAEQICKAKGFDLNGVVYLECNPNTNSKLSFYDEEYFEVDFNSDLQHKYKPVPAETVHKILGNEK